MRKIFRVDRRGARPRAAARSFEGAARVCPRGALKMMFVFLVFFLGEIHQRTSGIVGRRRVSPISPLA